MLRGWRAHRAASPALRHAFQAFRTTVDRMERAKASLVSAAPGQRGSDVPLAEALFGFELGLAEASAGMLAWRVPEVDEAWWRCREGLDEATRRAESLRLEGSPQGYEELAGVLADLLEPLQPFAEALQRFRELGP
jgi:hypothetical protein